MTLCSGLNVVRDGVIVVTSLTFLSNNSTERNVIINVNNQVVVSGNVKHLQCHPKDVRRVITVKPQATSGNKSAAIRGNGLVDLDKNLRAYRVRNRILLRREVKLLVRYRLEVRRIDRGREIRVRRHADEAILGKALAESRLRILDESESDGDSVDFVLVENPSVERPPRKRLPGRSTSENVRKRDRPCGVEYCLPKIGGTDGSCDSIDGKVRSLESDSHPLSAWISTDEAAAAGDGSRGTGAGAATHSPESWHDIQSKKKSGENSKKLVIPIPEVSIGNSTSSIGDVIDR